MSDIQCNDPFFKNVKKLMEFEGIDHELNQKAWELFKEYSSVPEHFLALTLAERIKQSFEDAKAFLNYQRK